MKNLFKLGFSILAFSFCTIQDLNAQTQPTVNACCMTLNTQTTTTLNFDWVRGNGDYCLVVMRQTSNPYTGPVDGIAYSGSTVFGSGSNLGNSNYVVYHGTGTSITVTNLAVGTYYEAFVYEYNSLMFPYFENYTSSVGTGYIYMYTLAASPTVGPSALTSYNIAPTSTNLSWTPGNGSYSLIATRQSNSYSGSPIDGTEYSSSTCFGSGQAIGTLTPYAYSSYDGSASAITLSCLNPQTDYACGAFAFNGTSGANNYYGGTYEFFTTQATEPISSSTNLYMTDISDTAFTVNWMKPSSGGGNYSLVTVKAGSTNSNLPSDFSVYSANSVFGNGSQIGVGAYVVYNGTNNTARVRGLTTGTNYSVSIFEFNGGVGTFNNTSNYLTTSYQTGNQFTNDPQPTINSSALVLTPSSNGVTANWTSGNGGKRLVLVKPSRVKTALAFDGTNDYVSVPYNTALAPTASLTLEAWVYRADWTTYIGAYQTIAGNQEGQGGYQLYLFGTTAYAYIYRNGTSYAYMGTDLSLMTPGWHHLAMTFDGRYSNFIVDGALKGTDDAGLYCSIPYVYNNSFTIGADAGTSTTPNLGYFNGAIDEVRVWNIARSLTSIRSGMHTSMVGNETGLAGEWKMDEGYQAGTLARNNAFNNSTLDGTLNGMPATAAAAFTNTSGWLLSGAEMDTPGDFNIYTGNPAFMNGSIAGNLYYTCYNGTLNTQAITNLTPGTWYNFSLYEFNSNIYNNYLTSTHLTQDFQTSPVPVPTITSLTPAFGGLGLIDSINGTNFDGTTAANNIVYYGREKATVLSATTTKIKTIIPYCTSNSPVSVTVNSQSAYSVKPFVVTSSCSAVISPASFTSGNIAGGSSRQGTASGDIDQDGKSDLLYVDNGLGLLYINKNTSANGVLSWGGLYGYSVSSPNEVEVADLDGDGKLDPVIISSSYNLMSVFRCRVPIAFLFDGKQDFATLSGPTNISFADLDGDGRPEVIVAYSSGTAFSVFRNTSSIGYVSFAPRIDISGLNKMYAVKAGEIDGDGKPDIIAGSSQVSNFAAFRNTSTIGNISFSAFVSIATASSVNGMALSDLDADGDNDVILSYASGNIAVFKNNNTSGNITAANFVLQSTLTGISTSATVDVYDLDGDQKMDIVSGYFASSSIAVFEATGNFTFGAAQTMTGSSSGSAWLTLDDFSLDGKTDILAGTGGPTITTLNNVMNPLAAEPTTAASAINFSGITQTAMTVNFTAGSGGSRIIIAHKGSAVNVFPFDGTGYTPNTIFGSGTDLGGGNYVVYSGNGNSVTVTGLQSYTPYYFSIFEFNGSTCSANYLTSSYVSSSTSTLNTPPTLTAISNPPAICQNSGLQVQNLSGIGTGSVNETQTISITATSNNQTLLPNGNISVNYTSPNPTGSINYTTVNGQFGSAIITVVVNDNATNNNTVQQTFTITVNSNPTVSNAGPNQNICTSSTSLAANAPGVGTGTWSFIYTSNGAITIATLTNPTSAISNFLVGDSVRLAWTVSNAPCASSVTQMSIKRGNCPLDANFIASQTNVCGSSANITYTDLSTAASTTITAWAWSFPGGTPNSAVGQGPHIVAYSSPGVYSASLQVTDNTAATNTEIKPNYITITALPANAGAISGSLTVCQGQSSATYSVSPIVGASTYNWTVPSGGSIISGQGTTNIVVNYNNTATTGNVTVQGQNSCGLGGLGFQLVTINPLPANTGTITGATSVCQGQVGVTYSVGAINNSTGYSWIVPTGATITSGNNTQSITVTYSNVSVSGSVNVYGTNGCGTGTSNNAISVTVSPLPDPAGVITGPNIVCQNDTAIYTINLLGNTNGYSWSVPTGASIIAGNNTNTITVFYSNTSINGSVSVYGVNSCGNGTSASLNITVNPLPAGATAIVGNATICAGNNTGIYFVSAIPNATGYNWTLPAGVTINTGNNTNAIVISVSPTASSGQITAYGTNACGNGASSSLNLTVSPLPDSAGTITGNATVCQGQTGVIYTVPTIANATGYNWTVPLGASIISGNNTSSITVDYSNSALSGYVTVIGTNTCGLGLDNDSLAIVVKPLPGDAGPITGDSSIQICAMQLNVMYHIDSVSNATSYSWSIPTGATIVGSTTNDTIYVDYSLGAATGTIYVTPMNACGTGATSAKPITVDTVMSVNICMVTVNNNSSFNHVIWDKPVTTAIDSFRIYREITSSFLPIGTVGYNDFSEYVDSIYTPIADPNVTNYRYKISALDSCGNESRLSPHHRTIFLQANQGVGNVVNLNWVLYEGNTVNQYYIYRDTTGSGPMILLDSVPGSNFVYTDNNPSTNPNTLRYVLGVDWNTVCNPSIKYDVHVQTAINNSHSNIKNLLFVPNGIVNLDQAYGINIYPNPNNGLFYITLKDLGLKSSHFTIFDELGQVIMTDNILGNSQGGTLTKTVDLSSMANGVYSIRIEIDGSMTTKKLVIQK